MRRYRFWSLSLLILLALSTLSEAFTYYTAPAASGGSAGNSCEAAKTISTPKLTINAGAGCLAAGDTLIVRSGVYAELLLNVIPSGTAGNHTTIRSEVQYGAVIRYGADKQGSLYEGHGAVMFVNRNYVTFDGFTLDGTGLTGVMHIYFPGVTTNITIQNNEIMYGDDNNLMDNSMGIAGGHGSSFHTLKNNVIHDIGTGPWAGGGTGFYAYGMYTYASDSVIENNHIYNCSGHGLHLYNTVSGDNSRVIVRNNRIHNNGIPAFKPGIIVDGGANNKVYNNLVYSNGLDGIQIGGYGTATTNTLVYNNVIYGNPQSAIRLGSPSSGPSGTLITNNIFYGNGANSVNIWTASGTVQTTNLTGPNPLFVNAAAGNFRVQALSPAIGTGTNTNSVNPTDHVGTPYSLPKDIGAYDYNTVVAPNVLIFTNSPSTTILNAVMPLVTVCIDDSAGVRQNVTDSITLTIGTDANPTTTLTGGTGGAATAGCRNFTGVLALNKIGTGFTLRATSGALTIDSGPFNSITQPTAPTGLTIGRIP